MASKKISVKYCGGCNPHFDRSAFISGLQQEFPQFDFLGPNDPDPWFALVVCGCSRICASHENLQGLKGKMVLSDPEDFGLLREELARLIL